MLHHLPLTAMLFGAVAGWFVVQPSLAVELTAEAVTNPTGDGPDGKGNSADDTWQFWFELAHGRGTYARLSTHTATMPEGQLASGIPRRVQGPIKGFLPDKENLEGWIYHRDWDGRFEGAWGNNQTGMVYLYPYVEKGSHCAVALSYKVPESGTYTITGKVTDAMNQPHKMHDGFKWTVEIASEGKRGKVVGQGGPIGDGGDRPDSDEINIENVQLSQGDYLRLTVQPLKWWGSDYMQIEDYKIEKQ